ncbi:CK1/WORM6 protein kinase [Trichostrongylus colubriformis]|uniref:non-specific serine/threonine protein kinase n=1 Tax=Trichostrongylus colubriformis TaxID=6319 RepID=A0AAN8IFV4_TRICO
MPGAVLKPRKQPEWYSLHVLEEERPDLVGPDKKIEKEEAELMDNFIRDKTDLQTGDLIITDDNLDEENRRFNRYEVQLKYNEGRYTALYLISRQVCADNETEEKSTLYAMKIGIRPNSTNIILRMKRELRILNELRKNKCPYCPFALDSGRVADMPFIVMNLLDRNLEKLREQTANFRPATAFYIAMEAMAGLAFLHSMKYIHRDVKLANFCIGTGQASGRIYLIDYGDTVKAGKKIKYGTPDIYTLPYWSLDAHKRSAAREKGDAESWLYMTAELVSPGSLPWYKMSSEKEVQTSKQALWDGGGQRLTDNTHVHLLQELVRSTSGGFDHQLARMVARDAIESSLKGPLVLEWAPNFRVNLPQWKPEILAKMKAKLLALLKGGGEKRPGSGKASPLNLRTPPVGGSGKRSQKSKEAHTRAKNTADETVPMQSTRAKKAKTKSTADEAAPAQSTRSRRGKLKTRTAEDTPRMRKKG